MKRIGLSLLAVLVFVTVIASCFSFSVFADFSEQPLIRFKGASTVYQTLVDQQEFNMLSSSYISVFDLNRIRIVNTSNLSGQYLLYQIILVPCVNASDSSPTIAPKSGSITITSMSGTDSAKITCTPVSIRDHHSGEAVWFNKALLVSVQVIVSDSSNDNINLDFNPVSLFSITSTSNYLVTCYQVNCYSSDSPALWTIQNQIYHFYNSFNSRMPALTGYSWDSIVFNGNGGAEVSTETGTWWDAMLNSVKNLQLDIAKSASYQAQIDYASTDENEDSALTIALDSLTNANSIGSLTGFTDIFEIAPNDPETLVGHGTTGFGSWFLQINYDDIMGIEEAKNRSIETTDNFDGWELPYEDKVNRMIGDLEGGD